LASTHEPPAASRLSLWAPVVICMAAIFMASAQSDPPMPSSVSDKPLHALAYLGLGVLVFRAVAGRLPARVTWRRAAAALAITIGYAVSDELHQMAVPGRAADAFDLVADAFGASLALVGCWAWDIIRRPDRNSRLPTRNV
jgi:VanZ family protein